MNKGTVKPHPKTGKNSLNSDIEVGNPLLLRETTTRAFDTKLKAGTRRYFPPLCQTLPGTPAMMLQHSEINQNEFAAIDDLSRNSINIRQFVFSNELLKFLSRLH